MHKKLGSKLRCLLDDELCLLLLLEGFDLFLCFPDDALLASLGGGGGGGFAIIAEVQAVRLEDCLNKSDQQAAVESPWASRLFSVLR